MEKRRLGKSDVMVTPMAFGAWAIGGWMWGGAEEQAAFRAKKLLTKRALPPRALYFTLPESESIKHQHGKHELG